MTSLTWIPAVSNRSTEKECETDVVVQLIDSQPIVANRQRLQSAPFQSESSANASALSMNRSFMIIPTPSGEKTCLYNGCSEETYNRDCVYLMPQATTFFGGGVYEPRIYKSDLFSAARVEESNGGRPLGVAAFHPDTVFKLCVPCPVTKLPSMRLGEKISVTVGLPFCGPTQSPEQFIAKNFNVVRTPLGGNCFGTSSSVPSP